MPGLVCSAQSCVYNNAMYCSRGDIEVGGREAKNCQDTCCESFHERTHENARSSMGSPAMKADISCRAANCRYNQDSRCHAEHVDIAGAAASRRDDTECTTFAE